MPSVTFEQFCNKRTVIFFGSYIPHQCKKDLIQWAQKLKKDLNLKTCDIVDNLPDPIQIQGYGNGRKATSQYIYEKSRIYVQLADIAVFFLRDQCHGSEPTGLELRERYDTPNAVKRTLIVMEKHRNRRHDANGISGFAYETGIQIVRTTVEDEVYSLMKGTVRMLLFEWYSDINLA